MKLNENSWHARLYQDLVGDLPNNLCTYFWKYIGMIFIVLWLLFSSFAAIYTLGSPIFGYGKEELSNLGILLWMALIVILVISLVKKNSIVKNWISAKLNRICPKIEWYETDRQNTETIK